MKERLAKCYFLFLVVTGMMLQGCNDRNDPIPPQNLWQMIESHKDLSIMENAIVLAGLQPLFEEQGPYTAFAPTNQAFLTFFEEFGLTGGLTDLPPQDLQIVVLYHIVDDRLKLETFREESGYPTLFNGFKAFIGLKSETVVINDVSSVLAGNFAATNGLLHVVDRTFFIKARDGSIGIPGADGGQVGGGNNPNRRGP